ncbi:MAG TPA: hypothetical protein VG820_12505 [Fimbriimonadaceae bacterium]|nr:hypothetical protein [Fimbriimonadaceae bacterium]
MKNICLFVVASLALAGCSSGTGLTKEDETRASRLDQIAKQSGGDWDKVSDADKQYVINEISRGSEESAKRLIQMKGRGPVTNAPGGPKTPGH